MAMMFTSMKTFYPLTPPVVTIELLALQLSALYLQKVREYANRAFSPEACITVNHQLTKIFTKGRKLIEANAALDKISAVVGELGLYELPKDLKDQFSHPCVIDFPNEVDRKNRKKKK